RRGTSCPARAGSKTYATCHLLLLKKETVLGMPGTATCRPVDSSKTGLDRLPFTRVERARGPPRHVRGGPPAVGSDHRQGTRVGNTGLEVAVAAGGRRQRVVAGGVKDDGQAGRAGAVELRHAQDGSIIQEGDRAGRDAGGARYRGREGDRLARDCGVDVGAQGRGGWQRGGGGEHSRAGGERIWDEQGPARVP